MKANRQRFWMCFVEGREPPKHKHYRREDAEHEAERLASMSGEDVFLLEASYFCRTTQIQWKLTMI